MRVLDKSTPFLIIHDLHAFTKRLLDDHSKNNMLTWQNGTIPEEEIWVKIGCDHGRDSFKISYQILNS